MAEKDLAEKTLEAYNDVFADIVNGLLFGGEQLITEDALIDAMPLSVYKADGALHEQERDTAKYWITAGGEKVNVRIALFGMENQTDYDPLMSLRVMGYDGAGYRAQLLQDEKSVYPVVTLVLYFGKKRWGKNRSLHDTLNIPEKPRPYVSDYRINVFEIAWLSDEEINRFHSDFKIVADYFAHSRDNPDYRPTNEDKFRHVDEILKMFAVLTKDNRFVECLEDHNERRPMKMSEVLDRAEAKGENKLGALITRLKELGRVDDAFLAASDATYREKLYKELQMA